MKNIFIAPIVVVFLLASTACTLRQNTTSGSVDTLSSEYDVHALAERTAQALSQHYTAHATLSIEKADEPSGGFGFALEQELLRNGYIITPSAPRIQYTVGMLQDTEGLFMPKAFVRMRLPNGDYFSFADNVSLSVHTDSFSPKEEEPSLPDFMPIADSAPAPTPTPTPAMPPSAPSPVTSKDLPPTSPVQSTPIPPAYTASAPTSAYTPTYPVRRYGSAAQVAKRNNIAVADFCAWNGLQPTEMLSKGYEVYLEEPTHPVAKTHTATNTAWNNTVPPSVPAVSLQESANVFLPALDTHWEIQPGALRAQVSAWAARAGYQLVWKADNDFIMESSAQFQGDFLDAVKELFLGMQATGNHALRVTVYQGNKVLEITEG